MSTDLNARLYRVTEGDSVIETSPQYPAQLGTFIASGMLVTPTVNMTEIVTGISVANPASFVIPGPLGVFSGDTVQMSSYSDGISALYDTALRVPYGDYRYPHSALVSYRLAGGQITGLTTSINFRSKILLPVFPVVTMDFYVPNGFSIRDSYGEMLTHETILADTEYYHEFEVSGIAITAHERFHLFVRFGGNIERIYTEAKILSVVSLIHPQILRLQLMLTAPTVDRKDWVILPPGEHCFVVYLQVTRVF